MKWEKLSHLEHVLKRPDSYVGSTKPDVELSWVLENGKFVQRNLTYPPALLKIFDEILVNALDQHALHPREVTQIDVKIDKEMGTITVTNNGKGIPIVKHETENVYIPELIFGTLLTSSNYDDSEERTTGGRNGYGSKLTNIYSRKFCVHVNDPVNKLSYTWMWKNNMSPYSSSAAPKAFKGKDGEVTVTFIPDWARFGMSGMTDDVMKLFEKRVWDTAICQYGNLKVTFQDQRIPVKKLLDYANMHEGVEDAVAHSCDRWDVVVAPSNYTGFQQVSFVNGICTTKGGTHIDHVANSLSKDMIAELTKKKADGANKLKPANVRSSMFIFARSTIINPSFSSQIKSELTTKASEFGSSFSYTPKFLKSVLDTGIRDELLSMAKFKEQKDLKKSDGSKKGKISGIPKLDDANWAGGARSSQCTLIVTEGDSAKALAISGLSVVGRDKWGVFPLRGKPRNVRDASVKQLMSNQEFSDLKKILGLQQEKVYKSLGELRYGRLMIMTDADLDGSHIKGLVLNMIHCFWPSLLELGFVVSMVTPIIKVGNTPFFTDQAYRAWLEERGGQLPRGAKVKYYKGLGTSTSTEAKEYFKNIGNLTVGFESTAIETNKSIVLAFDKSRADARKEWLRKHLSDPTEEVKYGEVNNLAISDFIHRDMVNFSAADVKRSIPHMCDGLKPSQRKVMFGCMKRKLTSEIKVAQLSGYISEVSAYHHGEASLQGTIIGMAHNYMGSNNINLLEPCGQFGTRLMGGKDAASPRYIFTKLSKVATEIFDSRDDSTLNFLDDDGKSVEPEYYMPVMPMILVNGGEGIGTGYSSTVPAYNPDDIKNNIERCMRGEPPIPMTPWYKGFTGKVIKKEEKTWIFTGEYKFTTNGKIQVIELPPGKWTQDYKEHLDSLVEKGKITSFENHSTEDKPSFIISGYEGTDPVKDLSLSKAVHTTNMWLMTPDGIKKYDNAEEIIVDYFKYRLKHYKLRKSNLLKQYRFQAEVAKNKANFVQMVVNETLRVFKVARVALERDIEGHGFMKVNNTYDYLLNIKTYQYTAECIAELNKDKAEKEKLYDNLKQTDVITLWKNDLKI